ncbi:MAG: C25 family cysteine peptidase [Ignavibacterium sp.]|jgi:hypothetical protein|nr:C25 family cysteine peptidase [Ignavibacterium sp.]
MKNYLIILLSILFFQNVVLCQSLSRDYKVIESNEDYLILEFNFENDFNIEDFFIDGIKFTKIIDPIYPIQDPGNPYLPTRYYNIGIPLNSDAKVTILDEKKDFIKDKFIIAVPDSADQPYKNLRYNQNVYGVNSYFPANSVSINSTAIFRYLKTASLFISPFQFNPVERTLIHNKWIRIRIDYKQDISITENIIPVHDNMTDDYIRYNLVNPDAALTFTGKINQSANRITDNYWYSPNKNYYKIYLNKKGVYRVTYDQLIAAGISPSSGIQDGKLEIYNDGLSLPIDIVDIQQDGVFNSGDYFQFVGKPATPVDQYTRMNIYNTSNVYWFSYQADSVNNYKHKQAHGSSNITPLITNTVETLRWEKDTLYQKLGYADDNKRDYWFWNWASARYRAPFRDFAYWITDSLAYRIVDSKPQSKIRVGMHGLSNVSCVGGNGHDASIKLNGVTLGVQQWNGQKSTVFEKDIYLARFSSVGSDTVQLNSDSQKFEVILYGNICPDVSFDEVLINYFEIDYWRWNRTYPNYYYFKSPPNDFQENRYYLFGWQRDNMKIYVPSRSTLLVNPYIPNDNDKSAYFNDTITVQTEYYCIADDYYLSVDSIRQSYSSDLRNTNNGADYIIITHKNFLPAAERLADYRLNNIKGISEPRTKVVEITDVYNEFSYGLLNPWALQNFVKYAYENWQSPAPQYIVLMGDMSYDYRKIFPESKENFIPSIPYHSMLYGQAPSDNAIVTVVGNDIVPDLAIGRISCETLEEANVLVDKIINYPADPGKEWKQNVLLLSSGLSAEDENQFGFNDKNIILENTYLKPSGIKATKIFRYPNKPDYIPFQGEGPDIRREIDNGAVVVSYYGHGGGLQWDLVFTNNDILELRNGNKMPFVVSVTCYTAHYDNQEIFGEIFNSLPDRGSIAFFGSSGVTFWPTTANFNQELFNHIFTQKEYIIGKAINHAKLNQSYGAMIALLTLLGDPALELALPDKPDFVIKSSDIKIDPTNPLVNDSVSVKLTIHNFGRSFPNDTLTVKLYENIISDTTVIDTYYLSNFGEVDSTIFVWVPTEPGLKTLIATVNEDNRVLEDDHSDNTASNSFSVFDFGEPNIIKPVNGYFSNDDSLEFVIADIGLYFDRDFNYLIQINNNLNFAGQLLIQSPVLKATNGIVRWKSGSFAPGEYFWRAVIYDNVDTNFNSPRIFTITNQQGKGYIAQVEQLKMFDVVNMDYSESFAGLILNTQLKPPYPSPKFLLDSIYFDIPPDDTKPSIFTTDGSYFYFGTLPPFNNWSKTKIYKIGTGINGTNAGENYGPIPNLELYIYGNLMVHQGFLYSCTGATDRLTKIDINSGDTSIVIIPDSLLVSLNKPTQIGGVYLYSDGQYVYNLGIGTWKYPGKFVLRKFDPQNSWNIVGNDLVLGGFTMPLVVSFIISQNHIIIYENQNLKTLQRYSLVDGSFEDEWVYALKIKDFYAISYDHQNDFVYFNTFRPGNTPYIPAFFKYHGTYVEANGRITSQEIGPASKWNNLLFNIDQTNSNGVYKSYLLGKRKSNSEWVMIDSLFQAGYDLSNINVNDFNFIKLRFDLADSSFGAGEPMKFNSLKVNYEYLPEISVIPNNFTFIPDSMLHGLPVQMDFKVNNVGYIKADSVRLDFYHNLTDTIFYSTYVNVDADSSSSITHTISTNNLLYTAPVSTIDVKVIATPKHEEYYTFNNMTNNYFYVIRDSAKPIFNITFDGKEIINGDIISSEPEVVITLEDNSPLQLDSTFFTIVHTFKNVPKIIKIPGPDIKYEYTPFPNSKAVVTWTPKLEDGRHVLEVLAKDASGNFFDSTSSRSVFNVYNNPDLLQVYNYPNPFSDNTYFTFEIRGAMPPEELKIKIFTVAGRLIKEFDLNSSALQIGFNRIFWDGKDQDGDDIANGLYFYKIISKHGDETKTTIQKLAKVK